jgi:hypothetical protein
MDRFLQDQNIALYRRLLNASTAEPERRMIIKLLVEEMDKLKMSKNERPQNKFGKLVADQYWLPTGVWSVKTKHKLDRLSGKTTNRMLANPELPPERAVADGAPMSVLGQKQTLFGKSEQCRVHSTDIF